MGLFFFFFLWSCHRVITPRFSQRKRNRLREEGKLTQRMSESERVWQREMSPTLPCSFWTSRMAPTEWHRSHVQLYKTDILFFSLVKRLFRVFVDFGKRQQKNRGVCNFPVEKETEIQVSGAPLLDWSKVLSALNRVNCGSFALQGLNSLNSSFDSAFELNNGEKYNAREKFPVLLRQ